MSASELLWGTQRAPKARVASEVAALLAFSAIRNGDRVGLILSTSHRSSASSRRKRARSTSCASSARSSASRPAGGRRDAERRGSASSGRTAREAPRRSDPLRRVRRIRTSARRPTCSRRSSRRSRTCRAGAASRSSSPIGSRQGWERSLSLALRSTMSSPSSSSTSATSSLPDVGLATFEDSRERRDDRRRHRRTSASALTSPHEMRASKRRGAGVLQARSRLGRGRHGGSFVKPIRDLFARRARRALADEAHWCIRCCLRSRSEPSQCVRGESPRVPRAPTATPAPTRMAASRACRKAPKSTDRHLCRSVSPRAGRAATRRRLSISVRTARARRSFRQGLDLSSAIRRERRRS